MRPETAEKLISYVKPTMVLFGYLLKSSNNTGILSILISLNPFITLLLSVSFLKEELNTKNIIAGILAFISLALFSWK